MSRQRFFMLVLLTSTTLVFAIPVLPFGTGEATGPTVTIELDQPYYVPGETAEVVVTDTFFENNGNPIDEIDVVITSQLDPGGITLIIVENADGVPDDGVFVGSFGFDEDGDVPSTPPDLSVTLDEDGNDVITASYEFSEFGFEETTADYVHPIPFFDAPRYDIDDNAFIVFPNPPISFLDPGTPDVFDVIVQSDTDMVGFTLEVTETSVDSRDFLSNPISFTTTGSSDPPSVLEVSDLDQIYAEFQMGSEGPDFSSISHFGPEPTMTFDSENYDFGDVASVTVIDLFANLYSEGIDVVNATVFSTCNENDIDLVLTEVAAGNFTGTFDFTTEGPSSGATLEVCPAGDVILGNYESEIVGGLAFDTATVGSIADTTPPNHPPLSDLVSWYRAEGNFEDSAGSNDGVGQSTDGGVEFAAGIVGDAFEFDGDFDGSDWVEIENDPSLNFGTGSFTVSAWIKSDDNSEQAVMLVHGASGPVTPNEAGWVLGMGINGGTSSEPDILSGQIVFNVRDQDGQVSGRPIVNFTAPSEGEWHHLAAVVDRDNSLLLLYIDGQEVDTSAISGGFGTADNNGNPAIGAQNRGGAATGGTTDAEFVGSIDEVAIHSRALSSAEIDSMYEAGTAVLINSGDESTTSPDVTLTLSCADVESGCDTIAVEFANVEADTTESPDEIEIEVHSTTNSTLKTLNALETGEETGIFILEIDLGDGTGDTIEFTDGDDIIATGTFFDSAEGTKSVEATFTDAAANYAIQSDSIELLSTHGTILWLNPLRDVTATTGFTVSGNLTDAVTGEPISGELITFTGTGVTPSLQSVTTEGVTFTGTMNIVSCAIPTSCDLDEVGTDSDNSTNMVVHLDVGGKITFPAGTVTTKIYLQDMDDTNAIPFKYIVEENNDHFQPEANSTGPIAPGINVIQITSGYTAGVPNGIKEITITEVDGSNNTGFVGIAAVLTGNPDGLPFEQHQINFEEFSVGSPTSPFVVNSGHYFSTGFAQNIDANELDITAHFAGSSAYAPSNSTEEVYNVIANTQGIGGTGSETVSTEGGSITVATCSSTTDTDADGICDIWETSGVVFGGQTYSLGAGNLANIDNFGTPTSAASTSAIDIFVEIDCMSGYCPLAADITALKAEFARESLNGKPFKLHVVLSDQTLAVKNPLHVWTDADADSGNDFANIKKNFFGTAADRSTGTLGSGAAKLIAKTQVFHYALFAKNIGTGALTTPCGPSGQAELNGNDIIVALGCGFTGTAGSDREKRGTLMHELGHNLGLRHGGGDDDNCKPNLISVMSYSRQIPWTYLSATTAANAPVEWVLTYSRQALINLDENFGDGVGGLVEGNGLPITTTQWTGNMPAGSTQFKIIWGNPGFSPSTLTGKTAPAGTPVNWNNAAGAGPYTQNINKLAGIKGCDTGTTVSILKSYDEWSRLNAAALNFRDGGTLDGFFGDDGSFQLVYPDPDTLPELTPAVLEGIKTASAVGPLEISNNAGASITPDIAVDDSNDDGNNDVYVVWSDTTGGTSGKADIQFKKSTDGGNTFGPVQYISMNSGSSLTPRIAVSGNNTFVVWSDTSGGTSGKFDILMRRSLDGGTTWETVQNISTNSGDSITPDLAFNGSSVYVIWSDKTGGTSSSFDILFKKSSNGGVTWPSTSINLSTNSGDSLTPAIGVSGNSVYAVWSDKTGGTSNKFDILSKNSINAGVSWPSTSINLSTNSGDSLVPDVSVTPTGVYVVWSDTTGGISGKFDILMKRSTSLGGTFGAVQNISTNSGDSMTPRVAASDASVYVAWVDKTGGTSKSFDILAKKSTDSGASFGPVENISADAGQSITPAFAIDGATMYVTWGSGGSGGSVPTSAEIKYALRII